MFSDENTESGDSCLAHATPRLESSGHRAVHTIRLSVTWLEFPGLYMTGRQRECSHHRL